MATDPSTGGTGTEPDVDPEEVGWADQDEYTERVKETEDVVLPKGQMKMRVAQAEPMRQAALIEKYDIKDVEERVDDLPSEADIQQNPRDAFGDDADDILKMICYLRDLLVPNVMKPDVHWADPDADGFDLSGLADEDLQFLIQKVSGQDAGIMAGGDPSERKQQRAESFRQ